MENLRSFEDLEVWKMCRTIRREISDFTKKLPPEEKYRLVDQLLRCSRSVTNNIAEGFGRFHYQENIQFCRHSRGSLFELKDHLMIAVDETYMTHEYYDVCLKKIDSALALLNGYINYLKKRKEADKNSNSQ